MFVSAIFRACLGFARLFFGRLFPLYSCLFVFVLFFSISCLGSSCDAGGVSSPCSQVYAR